MGDPADYLLDIFSDFGSIRVKKMFGGHGVYRDGIMFALMAEGDLYLKVDEKNQEYFKERGLRQFTYEKNGKLIGMSYFLAPDEIFDDTGEAALWAERSFAAALRSRSGGG